MLYDPDTANDLRPWLIKTLEPICDAEPGALAEYILALLKHNAPETELKQELASQLEEFLEKETSSFIDTLFTALRTKSYLPYSAIPSAEVPSTSTQSADTGIPIPLDGLLSPPVPSPERGTKRGLDSEDYDMRGSKGQRLNDGHFSRHGRDDRGSWRGRGDRGSRMGIPGRPDYMDGGMNGTMDGGIGQDGAMGGMNGPGYRPPVQRGICRDYYHKGYCARGAYCKYSHGEEAVIPAQLFPMGGMGMGGMPFMPMMPNGGMQFGMGVGGGGAYDPHERMDMRPDQNAGGRPNHRTPVLPRNGDTKGAAAQNPGELPVIQDLTPQAAAAAAEQARNGVQMAEPSHSNGVSVGGSIATPPFPDIMSHQSQNGRGGHRGGRGGPRGTFGADAQSFRPEKRNDKTLVVEKIPEDKLSLGSVNEWFKRFGTVTNVAVDAQHGKALVSFANHEEAYAAWKSEDAVFSNRFVKVFWHRPLGGHGQMGTKMLAASAPLVEKLASKDTATPTQAAPSPSPSTPAASSSRKPSAASGTAALAARQKLLEQQIAEQKSLMGLLGTASSEERKDIMARLRKLGEEMKAGASATPPVPAASSSPAPGAKKSRGSTPRTEDREKLERERLDKELELHATNGEGGAEESTEDLKAKLAQLKAEAASLGISEEGSASQGSSAYRPYRGRGRGRGFFRGAMRGGPPRGSMKLDNRPKKLLVKGADSEHSQTVRDWYETTGQVESLDTLDNGDFVISFRTRAAAEQGIAKGTSVPTVGPVQVSWYSVPPSGGASSSKPIPTDTSYPQDDHISVGERAGSPRPAEEDVNMHEVAAGGWGADEDAFGML